MCFFRPFGLNIFGGDYYILDIDKNYSWAIVGTPNHKYGWILSRNKKLSINEFKIITEKLEELGFNWKDFSKTSF